MKLSSPKKTPSKSPKAKAKATAKPKPAKPATKSAPKAPKLPQHSEKLIQHFFSLYPHNGILIGRRTKHGRAHYAILDFSMPIEKTFDTLVDALSLFYQQISTDLEEQLLSKPAMKPLKKRKWK